MSNEKQQSQVARTDTPVSNDQPSASPENKKENAFVEIVRFALIALLIVLPLRWFVAQPFIVSGASMETTFHDNEYLIVDQLTYHFDEPERGDVIVFRYPKDHSKFFIKRIIGIPGDTVIIDGSTVTIVNEEYPQGKTLTENYISSMVKGGNYTVELKEDEYFVMGDNRDHSSDSRMWGALNRDEIVGRALFRLFPPTKAAVLPGNESL